MKNCFINPNYGHTSAHSKLQIHRKQFSPGVTVHSKLLFRDELQCPVAWWDTTTTVCHWHAAAILQQLSFWTPTTWGDKKQKKRQKSKETEKHLISRTQSKVMKVLYVIHGYPGDRLLGDTAHAPIGQCSCEDTCWHSCPGRLDPYPHSAHLKKQRRSCLHCKMWPDVETELSMVVVVWCCAPWQTENLKDKVLSSVWFKPFRVAARCLPIHVHTQIKYSTWTHHHSRTYLTDF